MHRESWRRVPLSQTFLVAPDLDESVCEHNTNWYPLMLTCIRLNPRRNLSGTNFIEELDILAQNGFEIALPNALRVYFAGVYIKEPVEMFNCR
jgi:hypothetical protein